VSSTLGIRRRAASSSLRAISGGTAVLVGAALLATPSDADASGISTARFGGEHGNPMTSNATAIYYNPAGIAESEDIHIFLDANVAWRSVSFSHAQAPSDPDEPAGAEGANFGDGSLFNVAAVPMIGATGKFGDFAVGAGFYVPFGGSSTWSKNETYEDKDTPYPGIEDGVQRWTSITGTLRSLYWTLAVAYNIESIGLSIGAGANLIRSEIKTIRARNANGSSNIASEGRSRIAVGDWQGSFSVGALFEAIEKKLYIGASYQARPNIAGGMKLDGQLINTFGSKSTDDIDVHQDMPDVIRAGAKWKVADDIELRLFGDFTRWSAFKEQCLALEGEECATNDDGSPEDGANPLQNVRRDWNDTFGVRVGGSYWMSDEVEIFTGLGYDGNAVPDETLEPALIDFHDLSVAIGGKFQVIEALAIAASYTQLFYIPRDTTGDSRTGPCGAGVAADECFQQPSTSPDAGGEYSQAIGVLNVNLDVKF